MMVSIPINRAQGGPHPVWDKFYDVIEHRMFSKFPQNADYIDVLFERELTLELEKFGAWTDWGNYEDPLWFPDQDSLTAFLLTYG